MSNPKRTVLRKPQRAVIDTDEIYSILDEGLIAHIGFSNPDSHETTVIPVAYGRDGDRILFHGSTGSRLFMALKAGVSVCATITLVDGIVAARSPFNSSMNYRSVMVFGVPRALEGEDKIEGLRAVSDRLVPGLWDAGREQTHKEYSQTMLVELELTDVTAKKRTGGALDDEDAHLPIWAGIIPIETRFGNPVPNADASHVPLPNYIKQFCDRTSLETSGPTARWAKQQPAVGTT